MDFRAIERANQKLNTVSRSAPRKILSLDFPMGHQSIGAKVISSIRESSSNHIFCLYIEQVIANDDFLRPSTGIYYSPAVTRPMTSDYQHDFFHSVGFSTQNNARLHSRQTDRRIPLITSPMR